MVGEFKTLRIWDELKHLDPKDVSKRSLVEYISDQKTYRLRIINREYLIRVDEQKIIKRGEDDSSKTEWQLQILIPIYLVNAKEMGLEKKWISHYELDGGPLFFTASAHNLYFNDLLKKYTTSSEFLKAGLALGGKKVSTANVAFELFVLPRIPILFIYRSGGDEFSNSIQVFFDASAKSQLPTDSLWLAIEYSRKCLLESR
jgi:hypothetical protein